MQFVISLLWLISQSTAYYSLVSMMDSHSRDWGLIPVEIYVSH